MLSRFEEIKIIYDFKTITHIVRLAEGSDQPPPPTIQPDRVEKIRKNLLITNIGCRQNITWPERVKKEVKGQKVKISKQSYKVVWYIIRRSFKNKTQWRKNISKKIIRSRDIGVKRSEVRVLFLEYPDISLSFYVSIINFISKCLLGNA